MLVTSIINAKQKKKELNYKKFELYHELVGHLVGPAPGLNFPLLDKQVAAVYEMRNFPEYYPVSIRILSGLKVDWSKDLSKYQRLLKEMDLTILYMTNKVNKKERRELKNDND